MEETLTTPNNTSQPDLPSDYEYYMKVQFIVHVVTCIIISIGLPLTLLAIYALYSMVRKGQVAPIFIINLLISDLIQLCWLIIREAPRNNNINYQHAYFVYIIGLIASVCFMLCVALERYLVIAKPLWYRFRRSIKISVGICVLIWALPIIYFLTFFKWVSFGVSNIVFTVVLLIPLPLFIFFLVGTLKSLSAASSVSSEEKRRIVAILVLVLLIYTLLFMPSIIFYLKKGYDTSLYVLSFMFLTLSPLADLFLYVFMRKGTIDKLLAPFRCCKLDNNDPSTSEV